LANTPTAAPSPALVAALLGLTFVTGVIDAVSVLGLGHVFVANMTGNVVFLGFAVADRSDVHVSIVLTSLLAFVAGAVAGGRLAAGARPRFARGLSLEVGFLALAGAVAAAAPTAAYASYVLVASLALAMGIRNALVRTLAIPDMTTTVLTLTITALAADSSLAGGHNPRWQRRVLAVLSMASGALGGALLLSSAPRLVVAAAALVELLAVGVLLKALGATRAH